MIISITVISRQIDIRLLPSLVPEEFKILTAQMIQPELHARIEKLKNLIDSGVVDSERAEIGTSSRS